ncbi:MAG: hypothetical protein ACOX8E_07380 [Ruminococcus sp.]
MSVKIRVSYSTDQEIAGVIRLLSPALKECRLRPAKGGYRRAYITLNTGRSPREHREGVKA